MRSSDYRGRLHIIEDDLLKTDLPAGSFDIVTSISVIEHFEGGLDSEAMKATARLLKPGGTLLLTTLMNEDHFKEFYLDESVYGDTHQGSPVYYQRHYDVESLGRRVIRPSGLAEEGRVYFGDYGFQCFDRMFQDVPKVIRAFYQWATPFFASRFLSYRSFPTSREGMRTNTSSGVIVVLAKPPLAGT